MKLRVAPSAGCRPLRPSKPNHFVTLRAPANPLGVLGRDVVAVGAAAFIAEVSGNPAPGGSMAGSGSGNRVGNFVQENLVHVVILSVS